MEDVGQLVYFTTIGYILWPFGIMLMYGYLVYFCRFGMFYQEESGSRGRNNLLKFWRA
jgi:hypothetical protein